MAFEGNLYHFHKQGVEMGITYWLKEDLDVNIMRHRLNGGTIQV